MTLQAEDLRMQIGMLKESRDNAQDRMVELYD